jgi:hypothetical protein
VPYACLVGWPWGYRRGGNYGVIMKLDHFGSCSSSASIGYASTCGLPWKTHPPLAPSARLNDRPGHLVEHVYAQDQRHRLIQPHATIIKEVPNPPLHFARLAASWFVRAAAATSKVGGVAVYGQYAVKAGGQQVADPSLAASDVQARARGARRQAG